MYVASDISEVLLKVRRRLASSYETVNFYLHRRQRRTKLMCRIAGKAIRLLETGCELVMKADQLRAQILKRVPCEWRFGSHQRAIRSVPDPRSEGLLFVVSNELPPPTEKRAD
jgi:hypothetical protein